MGRCAGTGPVFSGLGGASGLGLDGMVGLGFVSSVVGLGCVSSVVGLGFVSSLVGLGPGLGFAGTEGLRAAWGFMGGGFAWSCGGGGGSSCCCCCSCFLLSASSVSSLSKSMSSSTLN